MTLYTPNLIGYASELVLDRMQTLPNVAYSLRQLTNAYRGPAIIVRRSSDNTSTTIYYKHGLLDTVSLLAFCGSGNGFVSTWYSQGTASSKNAVQSTTGNQPQIVSSGSLYTTTVGMPAILFNGSSSYFLLQSAPISLGPITLNSVFQSTATAAPGASVSSVVIGDTNGNGGSYNRCRIQDQATDIGNDTINLTWSQATRCVTTKVLGSGNTTHYAYQNGMIVSSVSTTFNAVASQFSMGYYTNPYYYQGYISEAIAFNSALSDSNRAVLETNQILTFNIH